MQTSLLQTERKCDKLDTYQPPQPRFVPIVINGKLVFRFDPHRGLIEWQSRGERHVIDLSNYGGPEGA